MSSYLIQGSYSSDAWAAMTSRPQNRREAVQQVVEKLGGKLGGCWMAFGDYDFVVIADFPDDLRAAACAMAVSGSGALKRLKTTPLLSMEDAMSAMTRASTSGYVPPASRQ